MAQLKHCLFCKKEFFTYESNDQWAGKPIPKCYRHRKFCSNGCKQAEYRRRALDRNNRNTQRRKQRRVMPHLEFWAKEHGLI